MMSINEPAPRDLPPGYDNCGILVLALLRQVEDLATYAGPEELAYLAWRANKTSNNLTFAASKAGQTQRESDAARHRRHPEEKPYTSTYAPRAA